MQTPYRILFVCLGNICRSPLAEGVFAHLVRASGFDPRFEVDSAGTGAWHVGEPPDPRSVAVAKRHGIQLEGAARQARAADFSEFDLILAMDADNYRELEGLRESVGAPRAELALLRDFDPDARDDRSVPDPYYGGDDGFDRVFGIVHRSCVALLASLDPTEGR